ncbi:Uncharacterized protein APZ42_002099 [Daphnia magna]|uniref:Uncharacterized protein n=1 Tax=Daphnia magna TaxID=35525 RepID=A0A164II89_9CRUS|nr:Uncharacterized protein APZ42_002099 [Daphnia magna]
MITIVFIYARTGIPYVRASFNRKLFFLRESTPLVHAKIKLLYHLFSFSFMVHSRSELRDDASSYD